MPKVNQAGLAPVIIITLIALSIITAAGTYFALNFAQPAPEPTANPINNATPAPSISSNISIEEVKTANEPALLNMEGVEKVEVGEKDGKPCVVVFTFKETDEIEKLENNGLSGYEVVIQNTP